MVRGHTRDPKPKSNISKCPYWASDEILQKTSSLNFVGVGINVGESVVAMSAQGRIDVRHIKLAQSRPRKHDNYCTNSSKNKRTMAPWTCSGNFAPVERPRSPIAPHDLAVVSGTTLCIGDTCGDGDGREKQELPHDELPCPKHDERSDRWLKILRNMLIFQGTKKQFSVKLLLKIRSNLYDPNKWTHRLS